MCGISRQSTNRLNLSECLKNNWDNFYAEISAYLLHEQSKYLCMEKATAWWDLWKWAGFTDKSDSQITIQTNKVLIAKT